MPSLLRNTTIDKLARINSLLWIIPLSMSNESVLANEHPSPLTSDRRWLHWLTVLAVCLVWPLIWVGGLVTTYDAGMSVPGWPETYGDNLFLYPISTWFSGPFDLFIEHGHRLLGALVGFVSIGIVIAAFLSETRSWVKWMAIALLAMVVAQGALGGMRVVLSDRTLAMLHGCFGPACFAFCVALATVTGKKWWSATANDLDDGDRKVNGIGDEDPAMLFSGSDCFLLVTLVGLSYAQLVLGAILRHSPPTGSPSDFAAVVSMHILTAFGLFVFTGLLWLRFRRCGDLTLSRPSRLLVGLLGLQIILGTGTWVVNYGWPSFLSFVPGSESFLVHAKGFWDAVIVTSHVATGSLILAIATLLMVRLYRAWYVQAT